MYNIKLSDPSKLNTIDIPDTGLNESTDLGLYGPNYELYGEYFWKNILHLSENFCNNTAPTKPIQGQLWYNSSNKTLNVFDETWNTVPPTSKIDTSIYIKSNVDDIAVNLRVRQEPKEDNDAATKLYADNWHGGIKNGNTDNTNWVLYPNKFIIINGIGSGNIKLPFEMADINYSAVITSTDQYDNYLVSNKTTTGFTINGNQWMVVGLIK